MGSGSSTFALNKRERFESLLQERIECGISLLGWEVKSLRAGNINFSESHVLLRKGEAFLFGCVIQPLTSASTHVDADPMRTRRLLLHKRELDSLIGQVERRGFEVTAMTMAEAGAGPARLTLGVSARDPSRRFDTLTRHLAKIYGVTGVRAQQAAAAAPFMERAS